MTIDKLPNITKYPKDGIYTEDMKKAINDFINSMPSVVKALNWVTIKIHGDKND